MKWSQNIRYPRAEKANSQIIPLSRTAGSRLLSGVIVFYLCSVVPSWLVACPKTSVAGEGLDLKDPYISACHPPSTLRRVISYSLTGFHSTKVEFESFRECYTLMQCS